MRRDRRLSKKQRQELEGRLAYERIAQALEARRQKGRAFSVLVVGAVHGDGSSTVTKNLASVLGLREAQKVLVIDANLRSPGPHEYGKYPAFGGLTEVLQTEGKIDDALRPATGSCAWLLPCGAPVETPSQVLTHEALADLMEQVRPRFDFVLVDGPPVTNYTDALILAQHVDVVVMVVAAEKTRWETAQEAVRLLQESGSELLGVILNRRRFYIPEGIYRRL